VTEILYFPDIEGCYIKEFTGKVMDVSFGVIFMTAVVVMAIGLLADLIDKRIQ